MTWYVRIQQDGQAQGPFTDDKIAGYVAAGRMRPEMWFSQDGETWAQNPPALFPPATTRAKPIRPPAPAAAPVRRQAPAPRRHREPEDDYDDDPRDHDPRDHAAPATKRSPAPWVFAAVTIAVLGLALVVDQWATTNMTVSLGKKFSTALHYGRTEVAAAVHIPGDERATKINADRYTDLRDRADDIAKPMFDKTILYGKLLLWLTVLACVMRLAGAYLVWQRGRFQGGAASLYVLATAFVASVFVVALLFNDGGVLAALSTAMNKFASAGATDITHGFGFSTWMALLITVVDAFGILGTKAAMTPRRVPVRRRSRQIR